MIAAAVNQQQQLQQIDLIDYVVTALDVDGSSNVYVGGYTYDGTTNTYDRSTGDAFIRRLNYSSHPNTKRTVWETNFGTIRNEHLFTLALDNSANVYFGGNTDGSLPGFTNSGGFDAFITKLDNSIPPYTLWTRQFGTSENDEITALAIDGRSNIYLAGNTDGSLPTFTNAGYGDVFIMKLDSSTPPKTLWTIQLGTSENDKITSLAVDNKFNVYVGGYTDGSFSTFTNAGNGDAFVMKIDSSPNPPKIIWTRQFGTIYSDYIYALAIDSQFNVYVGGSTDGSFSGYTNVGSGDAFVVKFDSSTPPKTIWTTQFGTSDFYTSVNVYALAVDSNFNVYLGGYTDGSLIGLTNRGGYDAFSIKLDSKSTPPSIKWRKQFGSSENDYIYALAVDSKSKVFLGGSTDGLLSDETYVTDSYNDGFVTMFDSSNVPNTIWTSQFNSIIPMDRPTRAPTPRPTATHNPTRKPTPQPSIAPIFNPYPENANWSTISEPETYGNSWHCITSDSQGVNLVAGGEGTIKYSRDGGKSWIISFGDYQSQNYYYVFSTIASSASGQFVVVGSSDEKLWISINYGQSFSLGASFSYTFDYYYNYFPPITDVAISSDGTKVIVTVEALEVILYTLNTDSGEIAQVGTLYPYEDFSNTHVLCISTDSLFRKLTLGTNGSIYYSSNGGSTWAQSNAPNYYWKSIGSSSNGQYFAAVALQESIYYSKNSGATWTKSSIPTKTEVRSISSSASGRIMAAAVYNSPLYLSYDYGQSWVASNSIPSAWFDVAVSGNGGVVFGADSRGNGIFKSFSASSAPTFQPSAQATSAPTVNASPNALPVPLSVAVAGLVISGLLLLCGAAYVVYLKISGHLCFKPENNPEKSEKSEESESQQNAKNVTVDLNETGDTVII